jgi:uncharacterized protein YdeI (YjbR/CyaY-like superfamily)
MSRDKRVDAYIAKAPEFARPILKHFREVVHEGCPDVEETIKWSVPAFTYKDSMLAAMSAHKEHCRLIFWKGDLIQGPHGEPAGPAALGKPAKLSDLPPRPQLLSYVRQAAKLNAAGVKLTRSRAKKPGKPAASMPADFNAALKKKKTALQNFASFTDAQRRDYIEWVMDAKREATRVKRIDTAVAWIAEGKTRNWKYM